MSPSAIIEKMLNQDHFSQWLGIKVILIGKGECKLQMKVNEQMTNGFKIAHGGICFSIADSCLAFTANSKGHVALTKKTSIQFFKKVNINDQLTAHSSPINDENMQYMVNIFNQNDEKVAEFNGEVHYTSKMWTV
jgi:acyl-CoA thioesterase